MALKIKRSIKNRGILLIGEIINIQRKMNGSMGEKIFFTKTHGSHPEEKFGLEAMDPNPKRNLIRE